MEKIIAWLNSERDYYQGLALLHEFSKNRQLLMALTRKANSGKLEYELKKIAPRNIPVSKKATMHPAEVPPVSDRLKIIRNHKTIQLEDLPKRLQSLYQQNVEMYKVMRALHERAKIIQEDSVRQPVIEKLIGLDQQVRANWGTIDSWDGQPDVPGGAIDHKRINANRKFITDNRLKLNLLPAGKERDELKSKMQQRINELLAAGEVFSKIKNDLINQGFQL